MHHEMRMRYVMLPTVTCPAVLYLLTLPDKGYDFRRKGKGNEEKMRVFIFSTTFV
jgi:hypothetical protein